MYGTTGAWLLHTSGSVLQLYSGLSFTRSHRTSIGVLQGTNLSDFIKFFWVNLVNVTVFSNCPEIVLVTSESFGVLEFAADSKSIHLLTSIRVQRSNVSISINDIQMSIAVYSSGRISFARELFTLAGLNIHSVVLSIFDQKQILWRYSGHNGWVDLIVAYCCLY